VLYAEIQLPEEPPIADMMTVIRDLGPRATTCMPGYGTVFIAPIEVQGRLAWAIVDSGASLNIVSRDFLESLPRRPPNLDQVWRTVRGANGSALRVVGKVALELSLAGTLIRHPFTVAEDLTACVVVGNEVFDGHRAQLLYHGSGIRALTLTRADCPICDVLGKTPQGDRERGCEDGEPCAREGAGDPHQEHENHAETGGGEGDDNYEPPGEVWPNKGPHSSQKCPESGDGNAGQ
jgi:hypothetical protein